MRVSFLKAPIGGIIGLEMITFVEPLGLECVAGGLEPEGHTCQIIDMRIDGVEKGFAKLRAFGPDIIGLFRDANGGFRGGLLAIAATVTVSGIVALVVGGRRADA